MMHGFTQLVPLRGVPLSLVSIQLTRSNSEGGRTLSQLVSHIRAKSGGHRPKVDDALEAVGWKDDDAELYSTFWATRNELRAYDVDERFPAFTLDRLTQVIPNIKVVSRPLVPGGRHPLPEPHPARRACRSCRSPGGCRMSDAALDLSQPLKNLLQGLAEQAPMPLLPMLSAVRWAPCLGGGLAGVRRCRHRRTTRA